MYYFTRYLRCRRLTRLVLGRAMRPNFLNNGMQGNAMHAFRILLLKTLKPSDTVRSCSISKFETAGKHRRP